MSPVDDSGGDSLADTPAGVFARLAAEAALEGLAPVPLLAMLKHPLLRLGAAAGAHARRHRDAGARAAARPAAARRRGGPGSCADDVPRQLARHAATASDPRWISIRATLRTELAAAALDRTAAAALAPLESSAGEHPLAASPPVIATSSRRSRDDSWNEPLYSSALMARAGARVRRDRGRATPPPRCAVAPPTMPSCFSAPSRPRGAPARNADVRVRIFGPLEARLHDRPPRARRPERRHLAAARAAQRSLAQPPDARRLGLDPPERRIGLSAHDFAQALGAPEVILTRAAKVAGARR